jgi:hypothetical protein
VQPADLGRVAVGVQDRRARREDRGVARQVELGEQAGPREEHQVRVEVCAVHAGVVRM